MGQDKPYEKRRKRSLTDEELELWKLFSKQIKPLKTADRSGKAQLSAPPLPPDNGAMRQDRVERIEPIQKPVSAKAIPKLAVAKNSVKPAPRPHIGEFDEKLANKVGKGRIKIDAKLDLHGMRQDEAKTALRQFIFASLSKGHKVVLVITGKETPVEIDTPWNGEAASGRGILKRMVPYWLREPDIASAVVSYTTARLQHGGEGALYIHIRSRKRRH